MKIQISKEQTINEQVLLKILELHRADEARKRKLGNYYMGEQAINQRIMSDSSKPNNRTVHSYGNYITDSVIGYFMGQPVKYAATQPESEEFLNKVDEIFLYNDEQSENIEIAKDASKYGVAYELLYIDEDSNVRFRKLDPVQCIPVYSNTLEQELLYFIRYYGDNIMDAQSQIVEIYSNVDVAKYSYNNLMLKFAERTPHPFKMVPVATYYNNEEELGDYELVISLIDAYDKLTSDSINDFEAFADAYLTLKGMDGTDADDISIMKHNRVLLLPMEGSAEWLTKNINDTYFQNVIGTIDADIHKFSKVPNMMDEAFGSNLSGIAIKYKLMGLENKVAIKEAHFKRGLQRRIELISKILYIMGNNFDYLSIDIHFNRNLPVNELEAVQMANALMGIVSDETAIGILPFVNNAKNELDKRNKQIDFSFDANLINSDENETN